MGKEGFFGKLFLISCAFVLSILIFRTNRVAESFELPREGEISKRSYTAEITFDIKKRPSDLEQERNASREKILSVFEFDNQRTLQAVEKIKLLHSSINDLRQKAVPDSEKAHILGYLGKNLSENTIAALRRTDSPVLSYCYARLNEIFREGISNSFIAKNMKEIENYRASHNLSEIKNFSIIDQPFVTLIINNVDNLVPADRLLTKEQIIFRELNDIETAFKGKPEWINAAAEILYAYITPNIFFDSDETAAREKKAAEEVLTIKGKIIKGVEIIAVNQLVTADVVEKLQSMQEAVNKNSRKNLVQKMLPNLGWAFFLFLSIIGFAFYLGNFRPEIYHNRRHLWAIFTAYALGLLLVNLVFKGVTAISWPAGWAPYPHFIIPTSFAPMLVCILFDLELSIVFSIAFSIIVSMMLGFDYEILLVSGVSSIIAAASVRKIRYYSQFAKAMLFLLMAYAVLFLVIVFLKTEIEKIMFLQGFIFLSANSLFSFMLVIASIRIFEKLFEITTDLRLVELSDMNLPLLKNLSIEAPGTYHHSVIVASLAEAAAETIGANPLIARVGSYYHDIGKMEKAKYFIENQVDGKNKHDDLPATMSVLVIASHVKEGIDLAKKFRLPKIIADVIPQHHGTSVIPYFYRKAQETMSDQKVDKKDFSYQGPKPQSRENAIIMLADSIEAVSRSLGDPSPARLATLTKRIIEEKFEDGQLDESSLSVSDLKKIADAFMVILTGIFHSRIEYPKEMEESREKSS